MNEAQLLDQINRLTGDDATGYTLFTTNDDNYYIHTNDTNWNTTECIMHFLETNETVAAAIAAYCKRRTFPIAKKIAGEMVADQFFEGSGK